MLTLVPELRTRKWFTWTVNKLVVEVFTVSLRAYSENLRHGPFSPLWPKRSAYGVAGLRFGNGPW